ncbi:MAG: kelch repeat-containing protein [Verrucomicrobiota bacterium]
MKPVLHSYGCHSLATLTGSWLRSFFIVAAANLLLLGTSFGAYSTGGFLTGFNQDNNYSCVAVGPGNVFYGAWKANNPAPGYIKFATFNGTVWTEIATASFTGTTINTALGSGLDQINDWGPESMVVDASGNIHIVFAVSASAGGANSLRGLAYGKYTASSTSWAFRKLFILQHPSGFRNVGNGEYSIKLDTSGNPHLVFVWSDASDDPIREARLIYAFYNGTVWNVSGNTNAMDGIQVDISDGNNQEGVSTPDIVFDSAGNLHCCYSKEDSPGNINGDCWYSKKTGASWSAPVEIADVNNFRGGSIVLDSGGKVHIGDVFKNTGVQNIVNYRVITNASGSWVTSTVASYTAPAPATSANGSVIMKINGGDRRVFVSTINNFGGGSTLCEVRTIYETAPGTWAQEVALSNVGDAGLPGYSWPSMTVRNSDNTIMSMFMRSPDVGADERNLRFITGVPTGYTGGGGGTSPEIAVEQPTGTGITSGGSRAYGTLDVGTTETLTFTVKNTGTGALALGAITFGGTHPTDFKVTTAPGLSSLPATTGTTTFVVTYSPLGSGARSAVMHIASDDSDENPFDVNLSGTATTFVGGTWTGGTPVIDTTGPFNPTGLNFDIDLGFVPTPGVPVVLVEADGGITGTFNDLPDGGVVAMAINGVIYYFQVDYTGTQIILTNIPAGPAAWKWVSGPNARNGVGVYGTINVAAGTNNPGGRQGAVNWRGQDGSLWMFGGYGYATAVTNPPRYLNDLWQYNRVLGQWVWRAGSNAFNAPGNYGSIGVEAASNAPGARHTATTWTDSAGNLWMFGGFGIGASGAPSWLNDLWRFNRTTGQWTWMKGSTATGGAATYGVLGTAAAGNTPGARSSATGFYRSGSLWLFGGYNNVSNYSDLWRYEIATGNWTWMKGANTANANGTYGTLGTAAAANTPGARRDGTGWVALDGTLWLFGGLGQPASGATMGDLSDLWKYDPVTGNWTWIKGSDTLNATGVYGTVNVPAAGNLPGARSAGSGWSTIDGDLWLIAGFKNSNQSFDDVWIYDIGTNQWTWILGSAGLLNQTGVYGSQGTAAVGNKPGGRFTPSTWVTLNGSLWIFGGGGADAFGNTGRLSDLWRYGIQLPSGVADDSNFPDPFPSDHIVNGDPNASSASAGTMAYVPVSGQLTGTDPDGDRLLFGSAGSTTTSQGTLTLNVDGTWTYTPAYGFTGVASFQFKAADNYGGESSVKTLVISVIANPADSDGDGIADSYEQSTWGSLAAADGDGDDDHDGRSNYFEFLAGTNPRNGNEVLATAPSISGSIGANGHVMLQLSHVRPGVNYHLETSTDLDAWSRVGTFTFDVSGSATIEDPTPSTVAPKFYRMSLEATPAVMVP